MSTLQAALQASQTDTKPPRRGGQSARAPIREEPARTSHAEEYRWRVVDGKNVMPQAGSDFLDWLLTNPRVPESQNQYAIEHNINERTLRKWKIDPRFVREWELRADALNIGVERVQAVMDNLYRIATSRQDAAGVTAANQYMQMVERFTPKKTIVISDSSIDSMSNAELAALAGLDVD